MEDRTTAADFPAAVEPLGPLAKRLPQGIYFPLLFWTCVIALVLLFGFIGALLVGLVGPKVPDESFRQFQLSFPLVAGPVGGLFFGGLGYYCWSQMQKRVWVSPVGFAWVGPGLAELFPWDRLKRVRFPLTVERDDGYKVNLFQYLDGTDSAMPFEEFWVPPQVAKVREQLGQGQTVKFGAFQVGREGVTKGGELLPWSQVEQIVRLTGQVNAIQLRKKGRALPWCTVGLNSVPNHMVFQRLVVEMVSENRGMAG